MFQLSKLKTSENKNMKETRCTCAFQIFISQNVNSADMLADLAQGWVLVTSGGSTPTLRQMTSATETVFIRSRIRQVCISRSSPTIAYVEKRPVGV
jgi:hypothetical protein